MDRHDYARLAQAQGLRTLEINDELWVMKRPFFLESIPPHRCIHLTRWGAAKLFLQGAAVLRYTCDETEGSTSFEYICDDRNYDLSSLDPPARRSTKQGLKQCLVRQIAFSLLAEEGYAINQSVFCRQGRPGPPQLTEKDLWKMYMAKCCSLRNVDAWGAFVEDKLCAFILTVTVDGYAYLYHPHVMIESQKYRPMNALLFTAIQHLFRNASIAKVSYGLETLPDNSSLEHFKLGMGFRKEALHRRVLINPLARPLLGRTAHWIAERLLSHMPKSLLLHDLIVFSEAFQQHRVFAD
jgi:hypothetical protein